MKKNPTTQSPTTITVALLSLGVIVGLLQATIGLITLTPSITADYHREIKDQHKTFAASLKFIHELVGKFDLAALLSYSFGFWQLFGGILLCESGFFTGPIHHYGNYILAIVNLIILGLQVYSGIRYELWACNLVFSILLLTRLILIRQQTVKRSSPVTRSKHELKPTSSTPKKKTK